MSKETLILIKKLTESIRLGNQQLINHFAIKLANRLYIPNEQYSFEDVLYGFGYREIIKTNEKQISIEEYMRERKQ